MKLTEFSIDNTGENSLAKGDVVVLGSGLMGSSIAMDLLENSAVSRVAVVDSSSDRLRALQVKASKLSGLDQTTGRNLKLTEKLQIIEMDIVKKREELQSLLSRYELGVGALPHEIAEEVCQDRA